MMTDIAIGDRVRISRDLRYLGGVTGTVTSYRKANGEQSETPDWYEVRYDKSPTRSESGIIIGKFLEVVR